MSTLTAIFESDADGTLHLPLPAGMHSGKFKVFAIFTPVESNDENSQSFPEPGFGCLKGKIHMADDFDAPIADFQSYME